MGSVFGKVLSSFFGIFAGILRFVFGAVLFGTAVFLLSFCVLCGVNPFCLSARRLRRIEPIFKYFDLFRWLLVDFLERDKQLYKLRSIEHDDEYCQMLRDNREVDKELRRRQKVRHKRRGRPPKK